MLEIVSFGEERRLVLHCLCCSVLQCLPHELQRVRVSKPSPFVEKKSRAALVKKGRTENGELNTDQKNRTVSDGSRKLSCKYS